jgi:uncharacterized protein with HEPN domain
MSSRTTSLLISDILESIDKIYQYTKGMDMDQFCADDKTIDAVIRNFEIIGEAANRIPESVKEEHPDLDWHRIRGFRNRIVHDYMGIDFQLVWRIKEQYLPLLKQQISGLS